VREGSFIALTQVQRRTASDIRSLAKSAATRCLWTADDGRRALPASMMKKTKHARCVLTPDLLGSLQLKFAAAEALSAEGRGFLPISAGQYQRVYESHCRIQTFLRIDEQRNSLAHPRVKNLRTK